MASTHEQLLDKHRRALEAETREEDLMRRSQGVLVIARRIAFQKLTGELEPGPDETPASLAEQITTLSLAIDRTDDLRRVLRGHPTSWSALLEELRVPTYDEEVRPPSLLQVHEDR